MTNTSVVIIENFCQNMNFTCFVFSDILSPLFGTLVSSAQVSFQLFFVFVLDERGQIVKQLHKEM